MRLPPQGHPECPCRKHDGERKKSGNSLFLGEWVALTGGLWLLESGVGREFVFHLRGCRGTQRRGCVRVRGGEEWKKELERNVKN